MQFRFFISSALLLLCTSACSLWMHTTDFNTGLIGEFELQYDSTGNCSLKVNGKYSRDGKSMVAQTRALDYGKARAKPGNDNAQYIRESVYCIKPQAKLAKGQRYGLTEVSLSFDRTEIVEGRANYTVLIGYEPLASLNIFLGNEIVSGVSIPGGNCPYVYLISNTMSLLVKTEGAQQQYIIRGKGEYYCDGNVLAGNVWG